MFTFDQNSNLAKERGDAFLVFEKKSSDHLRRAADKLLELGLTPLLVSERNFDARDDQLTEYEKVVLCEDWSLKNLRQIVDVIALEYRICGMSVLSQNIDHGGILSEQVARLSREHNFKTLSPQTIQNTLLKPLLKEKLEAADIWEDMFEVVSTKEEIKSLLHSWGSPISFYPAIQSGLPFHGAVCSTETDVDWQWNKLDILERSESPVVIHYQNLKGNFEALNSSAHLIVEPYREGPRVILHGLMGENDLIPLSIQSKSDYFSTKYQREILEISIKAIRTLGIQHSLVKIFLIWDATKGFLISDVRLGLDDGFEYYEMVENFSGINPLKAYFQHLTGKFNSQFGEIKRMKNLSLVDSRAIFQNMTLTFPAISTNNKLTR